jgi:GntR family transcriptional regulator
VSRDRRPLALQVRDEVRALIGPSALQPGDQLPSEADLAARFDVARTTIREALKLLEQDGAIDVYHGRGRFVSSVPALERPVTRLESVTEMMTALGYTVTNRVLDVQEDGATADEAAALRVQPGDSVVRLERLRLQEEDPLIYSVDVIPRALLRAEVNALDWSGSLLDMLDADSRVVSATAQIRATRLPRAVAKRLDLDGAAPWLLMIQINFTEAGQPVIYSHDYHRGDSFTFDVLRSRD